MKAPLLFLLACAITIITVISSCRSEGEQLFDRYYTSGSLLYKQHCENCHGLNGDGLASLIPSFKDSIYLKNNINKLACIVRNGLGDTITVAGKTYTAKMPAQGNLSAIEVAEILTYVTNSFGNKMGVIDAPKVDKDWRRVIRLTRSLLRSTTLTSPAAERGFKNNCLFFIFFVACRREGRLLPIAMGIRVSQNPHLPFYISHFPEYLYLCTTAGRPIAPWSNTGRKVRATQSILLPNGKAPPVGDGKCHRK